MIDILSLSQGKEDCYLIKLEKDDKSFNLLVDCGKVGLVDEVKNNLGNEKLNGIVVTHIDKDHIIGVTKLIKDLKEDDLRNTFIIFNKYDDSLISYNHGEELLENISQKMSQRLLVKSYANNYNRENAKIERKRDKEKTLKLEILSSKQRKLLSNDFFKSDTAYITLLSPKINDLKLFMKNWYEGTVNSKVTNKSSVTFVLEFEGKRVLMLGDAFVEDVYDELKAIEWIESLDYIKISHHGARDNNKGLVEMVKKYKCSQLSVTIPKEQSKEKINHPDKQLIEDLLTLGCKIQTSTKYIVGSDGYIYKIDSKATVKI